MVLSLYMHDGGPWVPGVGWGGILLGDWEVML